MLLRINSLLDENQVALLLNLSREDVLALTRRALGDPMRLDCISMSRKRHRFRPEEIEDWTHRNSTSAQIEFLPAACEHAAGDPAQVPQKPRRGRPVH